jgi:hypothetical protein
LHGQQKAVAQKSENFHLILAPCGWAACGTPEGIQ